MREKRERIKALLRKPKIISDITGKVVSDEQLRTLLGRPPVRPIEQRPAIPPVLEILEDISDAETVILDLEILPEKINSSQSIEIPVIDLTEEEEPSNLKYTLSEDDYIHIIESITNNYLESLMRH